MDWMTNSLSRLGCTAALALATLSGGCTLGFRGEVAFDGRESMDGIDWLGVQLPDTPIRVTPGDEDQLRFTGSWHSVAGTQSDAEAFARRPTLALRRDGELGYLDAEVPLRVQGAVALELSRLTVPPRLAIDVTTGIGDVDVSGVAGAVYVAVDEGDVRIDGGAAGVEVETGVGEVRVRTSGIVDLHSGGGDVELIQDGFARDAFIATDRGDVYIEVASDANLALDIRAEGEIRVRTQTIVAHAVGELHRESGNGSQRIVVEAGGRVDIELPSVISGDGPVRE